MQNEINKIIAVASGKGGVGKSTIAVNIAKALAALNFRVGLLDADIYGPSQPAMLGTRGEHPAWQGNKLQPFTTDGIQSMSMGNLIDEYAPVIWRGPMLGKAMQQLLHDTAWGQLDYLIVDLPPGTGDVQISLCQKIPVNGALIVTTPQDLALLDVKRACEMFKKMSVPLIGVVENMSTYHCPQCGHESALFGQGGGEQLAQEYHTTLLANIPLHLKIREMTEGKGQPEAEHRELFKRMASQITMIVKLDHKLDKKEC